MKGLELQSQNPLSILMKGFWNTTKLISEIDQLWIMENFINIQ